MLNRSRSVASEIDFTVRLSLEELVSEDVRELTRTGLSYIPPMVGSTWLHIHRELVEQYEYESD